MRLLPIIVAAAAAAGSSYYDGADGITERIFITDQVSPLSNIPQVVCRGDLCNDDPMVVHCRLDVTWRCGALLPVGTEFATSDVVCDENGCVFMYSLRPAMADKVFIFIILLMGVCQGAWLTKCWIESPRRRRHGHETKTCPLTTPLISPSESFLA